MSGPGNVIELLHKIGPRDQVVMALVEGLRDMGKQATPASIANLIRGATGPKVAQVCDYLVKVGALERIGTGYGVTPAGIAALKTLDETYVPSQIEERRRGRLIPVPGVEL